MTQPRASVGWMLSASFFYFGVVFGAGFLLGPIRVLFVEPRLGERMAVLLEAPILFVTIVITARWVVCRFSNFGPFHRLGIGLTALFLLFIAEIVLARLLWGMSLGEYFASRDPVALGAFFLLLVAFALMPLFVGQKRGNQPGLRGFIGE